MTDASTTDCSVITPPPEANIRPSGLHRTSGGTSPRMRTRPPLHTIGSRERYIKEPQSQLKAMTPRAGGYGLAPSAEATGHKHDVAVATTAGTSRAPPNARIARTYARLVTKRSKTRKGFYSAHRRESAIGGSGDIPAPWRGPASSSNRDRPKLIRGSWSSALTRWPSIRNRNRMILPPPIAQQFGV